MRKNPPRTIRRHLLLPKNEEGKDQAPSGEIQERGVRRIAPGMAVGMMKVQSSFPLRQFAPEGTLFIPAPALPEDTHYEGKAEFGLDPRQAEADMKFELFRQNDGTYARQTRNGRNNLTALGGGGQVEKYDRMDYTPDCGRFSGPCMGGSASIFHTDATLVKTGRNFV